MTIGIRYAARSDVGMLREGNEDSAYAGARLLVVADGMGGHVGGEIASAAAVNALKPLDTDVPMNELMAALQHAVKTANENLHGIVESDPSLQGMGTTLTAMLWAGTHVALIHIGDSRAYLLRNGELFQITHDHTLVQSLVDEGRITIDEAASHPQRSLLLRALDGRGEVDPDVSVRQAEVGDRYLLCSDGLSGVVTAETIHQVLSQVEDPQTAVRQLIDLANRGGGPDNITCVIADVVELPQVQQAGSHPIVAGAAANAAPRAQGRRGGAPTGPGGPPGPAGPGGQGASGSPDRPGAGMPGGMMDDTPAGRAAALRDTMPQPPIAVEEPPRPSAPQPGDNLALAQARAQAQAQPVRPRRRWTWLVVALVLFVVVVGGGGVAGWKYLQSGYFVGVNQNNVVIFQGSPDGVFGLGTPKVKERPNPPIPVADLPKAEQDSVRSNIVRDNIGQAHTTITSLRGQMCAYKVAASGGQVVIVKGKGQPACPGGQTGQIQPGTQRLAVKELPKSDQSKVTRTTIPATSRAEAGIRFNELVRAAQACKADPAANPECPQPKKPS
jgi:serine/threonine protein phosphatase PrpC